MVFRLALAFVQELETQGSLRSYFFRLAARNQSIYTRF
jgi:hypothetical protein